jgi:hypothetical protein
VTDPYPPSNPTTGFTPQDEGFAGIIIGVPTDGSANLSLKCAAQSPDLPRRMKTASELAS